MGCFPTSLNRVRVESSFSRKEIVYLKHVWNFLKANNIFKFGDDVVVR